VKKIYVLLLALIFLAGNTNAYDGEKVLNGIIEKNLGNGITIKGKVFQFGKEPLIIFNHLYGSEVIEDPRLIPAGVYARCRLDEENKIQNIEFCNWFPEDSKEAKRENIYTAFGQIDNYQVSPDQRYLAFFSQELQLLSVIDLHSQDTLWQYPAHYPAFSWVPDKNNIILTYAKETPEEISICNLDLANFAENVLFKTPRSHAFVEQIRWSPLGSYLELLIIKGEDSAHGYSELIVLKKPGEVFFRITDNINGIDWSGNEKYIILSKYTKDDYSENGICLLDVNTLEEIPLPLSEKSPFEPFFALDHEGIYYSVINNLYQEVYYYNFLANEKELIFKDLKYLTNFNWLTEEELVFSGGYEPQILIFNKEEKKFTLLGTGLQPTVRGKNVYYIGFSREYGQNILYKYSLPDD